MIAEKLCGFTAYYSTNLEVRGIGVEIPRSRRKL